MNATLLQFYTDRGKERFNFEVKPLFARGNYLWYNCK